MPGVPLEEDIIFIVTLPTPLSDPEWLCLKDTNGHPQNYSELESFDVVPQVYATIVAWIKERD